MSGHSKWSKVKHQKATTDVVKAAAFTKASRAITIAVAEGGGVTDPNHNFRLRLAIEKARDVNMPKENISRAIEKGSATDGASLSEIVYEGFGPSGVAILIEAATDNRQRTASLVKNILDRNGGNLASPGAVSYLFSRVGILTIAATTRSQDQLLNSSLEAGVLDMVVMDDMYELYTKPTELMRVKEFFEMQSIPVDNFQLMYRPTTMVDIDREGASNIESLLEDLNALDDVLHTYANYHEIQ